MIAAIFVHQITTTPKSFRFPELHNTTWRYGTCCRVRNESATVRVVTIKHPPAAIEGITPDNSAVGRVYDLTPQLGILMIAAGWARSEKRKQHRRENDVRPPINRRRENDRRSGLAI
jgi:hypothetical protein